MRPALSLILCSRNDSYMGNSRWRLETALNYVAEQAEALGRRQDLEVLVADWGSEIPLARVVRLGAAARRMVSFLTIPPSLAATLQQDSPFPEVLALNAAARLARGEYIGRIDQDTLTGARFLEVFFDLYEGRRAVSFPLAGTLMFSRRRAVPYRFATRCPPLWQVDRFVAWSGSRLRLKNAPPWAPFYVNSVGIWMVHRDLWSECGGYDETMLYMGAMESNMIARLMNKYPLVDLGRLVDHAFFHLEHHQPWASRSCWADRRPNDEAHTLEVARRTMNPNGESWGLAAYALGLESCTAAESEPDAPPSPYARVAFAFVFLTVSLQVWAESRLVRLWGTPWRMKRAAMLWRHRLAVARATVRGRPVSDWRRALQDRWVHRDQGPLVYPRNIIDAD